MNMPAEVFSSISEDIIYRTNFVHESCETNTQVTYKIKDFQKAKNLYAWMDVDSVERDRNSVCRVYESMKFMNLSFKQYFTGNT